MEPLDPGQTKQTGAPVSPDASTTPSAGMGGVPPGKARLQISMEDVPEPVLNLLQKLAKPHKESWMRGFVKDYSSLLTPLLTAVIAICGTKCARWYFALSVARVKVGCHKELGLGCGKPGAVRHIHGARQSRAGRLQIVAQVFVPRPARLSLVGLSSPNGELDSLACCA